MRCLSRRLCAFFVLVWLVLVNFSPSLAATRGIGVSPGKIDVEVSPGDVKEGSVVVSNEGDQPIVIKCYVMDRKIRKGNEIEFTAPGNPMESPSSWLSAAPTNFSLTPGQQQVVTWRMVVPKDVMPGDSVAVLFFENIPEQQPGAVTIGARVGSLIAVRVKGEIKISSRFVEFKAIPKTISLQLVLFGKRLLSLTWTPPFALLDRGPAVLAASFENTGNVRLPVSGTVKVRNIFGREVASLAAEPLDIFPRDTDALSFTWEKVPLVGRFLATGEFEAGGREYTAQTVFWVLPVKHGLSLLLIVAGSILIALARKETKKGQVPAPRHGGAGSSQTPVSEQAYVPRSSLPSRKERKRKRQG